MPRERSKYGLLNLKIGKHLDFKDTKQWGKLRMAAHFTGRSHGMTFKVRKIIDLGKPFIRVYRMK